MMEQVDTKRRGRKPKKVEIDTVDSMIFSSDESSVSELRFRYVGARIYYVSISYDITDDLIFVSKIDVIVNRKPYPVNRMMGNIGIRKFKNRFDKILGKLKKGATVVYCDELQAYLKLK